LRFVCVTRGILGQHVEDLVFGDYNNAPNQQLQNRQPQSKTQNKRMVMISSPTRRTATALILAWIMITMTIAFVHASAGKPGLQDGEQHASGAVCPGGATTPRTLLAGDSWAQYMWDDDSHNDIFDKFGHADKRMISRSLDDDPGPYCR
jgi:hypothetical protein